MAKNWQYRHSRTQLHRARLREQGYVGEHELASSTGIHPCTVRQRAHRKRGIEACRFKVGGRHFTMYKEVPNSTGAGRETDLECPSDLGLSQQNGGVAK